MKPMTAGIRELKTHLSELLKKVQAGRELIVTNRGKSMVRILPPLPAPRSLDEWVAEMVREGRIEPPPPGPRRKLGPPLPVPMGLGMQYLMEDRESGR